MGDINYHSWYKTQQPTLGIPKNPLALWPPNESPGSPVTSAQVAAMNANVGLLGSTGQHSNWQAKGKHKAEGEEAQ